MKPKPEVEDGYHAVKCHWCDGTGIVVRGYKNPKEEDCYSCKGGGWKIARNPAKVERGNMERPIYNDGDSYFKFRSRLKRYLLSRRGNKCEGCGKEYPNQAKARDCLEVHHIKPRSKGGSDEDNNLTLLCYDCHQSRHSHSIGWHASRQRQENP